MKINRISDESSQENIKTEGFYFFETVGFSMWPFLKEGRQLAIRKVVIKDLKIGDIILYRCGDQKACHRLLKKDIFNGEYRLYVRGDNSLSCPEIINKETYLGKVVGIIKNDKIINLTTCRRQFINRAIVVIAPLVSRINNIIKPFYKRILK